MNREAERHLERAEVALARGEGFYRAAAAEIIAAQDADPTLTRKQIGERFGRAEGWVSALVSWSKTNDAPPTPYSRDVGKVERTTARRVLRDAPMEEVERIVADLPQARRTQIERALVETHPAHQTKTPLGVGDSVAALEANTSFVMLMGGSLSRLADGVDLVRATWDKFEHQASDEEKEIVQEQIRDAIASLLSINSDPQELLR